MNTALSWPSIPRQRLSTLRGGLRHWPLLLIAALLLQACSATRLGYSNADSLLRWWVDRYVALSPEQDGLSRERLGRFMAWHRKTQLPDYASLLRQGQELIAGQPTPAEALLLGDELIGRARILAEKATPDIADFLATITPEQIERMSQRIADRSADHAKEAQLANGESAQRKARYKRLLEQAEYWFGDFSSEQEAALRQLVDRQATGGQFWYEERLRRERDWLSLVRLIQRERPPRERLMALLRDYTARFDMPIDPTRLAQAQALRRASAEIAVAIHAMTSAAQRAHAQHKLDDLIRDFTELAQET